MSQSFPVSKSTILRRGLRNRCPNCGAPSLFKEGVKMHPECRCCGMSFERGEGFFLGSMSLNYVITTFVMLPPILILALLGVLPPMVAVAMALFGALLFPIVFYRSSRSWWLMAYFYFLPHELPANRKSIPAHEDDA